MAKIALLLLFILQSAVAIDWTKTEGPLPEDQYNSFVKIQFCEALNKRIKEYQWNKIICNPNTWQWDSNYLTPNGHPILFKQFDIGTTVNNTTLVLCAVHGDELPTSYLCIHLVRDILFDNPNIYKNSRVIVVPVLNPDGFLIKNPTRTNANGIDINRNFPTKNFESDAIKSWKNEYKSDKRRYPGVSAGSEIETRFQIDLINKYKPDKIITVHSPYGWLDVDVPPQHVAKRVSQFFEKAKEVGQRMSKESNNYPVTNFKIFPGSLGNYAAFERHIPTYTLELPKSAANMAQPYWLLTRKGFAAAINYQIQAPSDKVENQNSDQQEKVDYFSDED
jgi:protein MpaA